MYILCVGRDKVEACVENLVRQVWSAPAQVYQKLGKQGNIETGGIADAHRGFGELRRTVRARDDERLAAFESLGGLLMLREHFALAAIVIGIAAKLRVALFGRGYHIAPESREAGRRQHLIRRAEGFGRKESEPFERIAEEGKAGSAVDRTDQS